MAMIFETLSKYKETIIIIVLLMSMDITIATIKSIINQQYSIKELVLIIWKSLSNIIVILLCTILETVAVVNKIDLGFDLTKVMCYLIILIVFKNIINMLGNTELTLILRRIVDNLFNTLKVRISTQRKK